MRKLLVIAMLCLMAAPAAFGHGFSTTAGDGEYTLQVAAFDSKAQAMRLAEDVPNTWVQEIRKDGRPMYRVNYKRFIERSHALRAQWDLEDMGYKSFVQRLYT